MEKIRFTLGSIIRLIREQQGLKQEDLGMKGVSLGKIELGKRNPRLDTLDTIARHLGVTVSDIYAELNRLNGEDGQLDEAYQVAHATHMKYHKLLNAILNVKQPGSKRWKQTTTSSLRSFAASAATTEGDTDHAELLRSLLADLSDTTETSERQLSTQKLVRLVRVPYYEDVPAGNPLSMNPPDAPLWIEITRSNVKDSCYALRVMGDSMTPKYCDGDIVLIDHDAEPKNGDIAVALVDGTESTLKIFSRRGDKITLTPINMDVHKPMTYPAGRVSVQGVLIDVVRRGRKTQEQ